MIKFKFHQWKVTYPLTWRSGAAGLSNLPSITLKSTGKHRRHHLFTIHINYCQSVTHFCFCKSC